MIVDSHQHFWKYDAAQHSWISDEMAAIRRDFLPEEFAAECDANGVDASVAVQVDQTEEETLFLLDLAERHSRIAGVVGWIELRSPQIGERLQFFSRFSKLRGFRHIAQSELDDRFLVNREFTRGIAQLREFGLTYDILIYPRQLPAARQLIEKFPEQPFAIDHLAKPEIRTRRMAEWAAHMKSIGRDSKTFCKVSGMVTEADWHGWRPEDFKPYLDVVFDAFGPERLMFGSDWPVCLLAASYSQVKRIIEDYVKGATPADKAKIFGGNAMRFYGIPEAARVPAP